MIPSLITDCVVPEVKRRCTEKYEKATTTAERSSATREAVCAQAEHDKRVEAEKRAARIADWTQWLSKHLPDWTCMAPHLADYDPKPHIINGRVITHSTLSFWECVRRDLPPKGSPRDYPLVELPEAYRVELEHARSLGILMTGLGWHAMHDPFFRKRTPEWIRQVLGFTEMILRYAIWLVFTKQPLLVLNDEDLRTQYNWEVSRYKQAWVNDRFLSEVDAICSEIWVWAKRSELEPVPDGPITLDLKKWASLIREDEVVTARRLHYENMLYTSLLKRWLYIRRPDLMVSDGRGALVGLQIVPYVQHCKTFASVIQPTEEPVDIHERISLDAILKIYSTSSCVQDVIAQTKFVYNPLIQEWTYKNLRSPSLVMLYTFLVQKKQIPEIDIET